MTTTGFPATEEEEVLVVVAVVAAGLAAPVGTRGVGVPRGDKGADAVGVVVVVVDVEIEDVLEAASKASLRSINVSLLRVVVGNWCPSTSVPAGPVLDGIPPARASMYLRRLLFKRAGMSRPY